MKPYYADDLVTLYHGDCRDVLPALGTFDLLLTDPPYGIQRSGQASTICRDSRHNRKLHEDFGWDGEAPDGETFGLLLSAARNHVIWGGNYFTRHLPSSMGWIVWDKGQDFSTSDCELAYTSYQKALRRVVCNRGAIAREGALHPTQKPLAVVHFCLTFAGDVSSVVDPYCGSGSTLRAAKDRSILAVGIEGNERYCEIIAERMSQSVLDLGGAA